MRIELEGELKVDLEEIIRRVVREELASVMKYNPRPTQIQSPYYQSDLMSRVEVIRYFGISAPTYHRWIKYNILPKPMKIGGRVYFSREEVENVHTEVQRDW